MITTVSAHLGSRPTPVGVVVVVVLKFVLHQPTRRVRAGAVGRGSVDDEVPAAVHFFFCTKLTSVPRLLSLLFLSERKESR